MDFKENIKRFSIFMAGAIFIIAATAIFAYVWYQYFVDTIPLPYFRRGNWVVIGLYAVFVLFFSTLYGGLKIGYLKIMDAIWSQFLTMICVNVVVYIQICLIGRWFVNIFPFIQMTVLDLFLVLVWCLGAKNMYMRIYPPQRIIIIYGHISPNDFIKKLNSRKDQYNICGSIHVSEGLENIKRAIKDYESVIIWDLPAHTRNLLLKYCFSHSIKCYITPKISDIIISGADRMHMFDTPLLHSRNQGLFFEQACIKRFIDIVFSIAALIIASPFMLIIALLIKLCDKGPVFYKQTRLTINGKKFEILKFRSMYVDSEEGIAQLAKKHDSRVTPVGKVLRNIHFDELPQLINVLKGDMSLVGPRPERAVILREYQKKIPEFHYRLKVKAGLTGYAQVYGKYNTTPYDKLKLDLFYIENYSLRLDFKLMLMTIKILFQKENSEGVNDQQTTALK